MNALGQRVNRVFTCLMMLLAPSLAGCPQAEIPRRSTFDVDAANVGEETSAPIHDRAIDVNRPMEDYPLADPAVEADDSPLEAVPAVIPFGAERARRYQRAWAKRLATSVQSTSDSGIRFQLIPPGEFVMGSPPEEKERLYNEEQHLVRLTKAYFLGTTEVTQGQYEKVVGKNPSHFSGTERTERHDGHTRNHPVERVDWFDAVAFCNRLSVREKLKPFYRLEGEKPDVSVKVLGGGGYRLPTEAEWEYACRAGTTTPYHFGEDRERLPEYAWCTPEARGSTNPVGWKKPNAFGLHDMCGNVSEWCHDWYISNTASEPIEDPDGPDHEFAGRVFRGMAYGHVSLDARSALRQNDQPARQYIYLGFRVARTCPGQ